MKDPKTTISGYLGLAVAVLLLVKALLLGEGIDVAALLAAAGVAFPSLGALLARDATRASEKS